MKMNVTLNLERKQQKSYLIAKVFIITKSFKRAKINDLSFYLKFYINESKLNLDKQKERNNKSKSNGKKKTNRKKLMNQKAGSLKTLIKLSF
jgi:hypothetical protein